MASINSTHIQRNAVENLILICLDKNIKEYENSLNLLQLHINTIELYSNPEEFRTFIQQIKDEKLLVILSETVVEQVTSEIDNHSQIDSVYIYCNQKEYHENWSTNSPKIKGVYSNLQSIHDALRRDVRRINNDLISIQILTNKKSNELEQSFTFALLLKEILINSESNEQIKQEFIKFSRFYYEKNSNELNLIDVFQTNNYNQIKPIEWYTRECFISSMIHRALRLYDIEILYKLAFFIRDLHKQINDSYLQSPDHQKLTVYYGSGISNDQFTKLNMNINDIISFNTFLFTTIDRKSSLNFAKQSENDLHLIPVLFQIEIDRSKSSSSPFIALDESDYYHDSDRHVLFTLNSIFRITHIERGEDKIQQINLILIDDNEDILKNLKHSIQKQLNGFFSLGQIMMETNDLIKAKSIFEILLKNTTVSNQKELVSIHRKLGLIDQRMKDWAGALLHYKQCLNIQLSFLPSNDRFLGPSYAGVGTILIKLCNYDEALEYYQHPIDCGRNTSHVDSSLVATYYIGTGRILHIQGKNS
ncbi:unnamed protein product [Adineta steineri]|uniref:Uncharacterized protein n=1 Tax=Adineta steineri TaxID=433720 RepID=A0A815BPQ4_9BILA|nr:unnamed protein product [Adineta steineri]CAF1272462.1 unnamed protein product [Adineta steineri]